MNLFFQEKVLEGGASISRNLQLTVVNLWRLFLFGFFLLTLPSWLGQDRGWHAVAALADSRTLQSSGLLHSGSRCRTSMRLVMKKLFCKAATPFSGKMEVCLHTGQDSVRDWGGM